MERRKPKKIIDLHKEKLARIIQEIKRAMDEQGGRTETLKPSDYFG